MNKTRQSFTFAPLIVTAGVVTLDQLTKYLVIVFIPLNSFNDGIKKIIGDFLWLIHVRNNGAAFSLGAEWQSVWKSVILFVLPVLLIAYLLYAAAFMKWKLRFKYLAAVVAGGGIGNMLDRFFRSEGVVDFISVKIYGLFGMQRWPTFNIADSSIVVGTILWLILTFIAKDSRGLSAHSADVSSSSTDHTNTPRRGAS